MAAGRAEERIYQRVGYQRVTESLHISCEISPLGRGGGEGDRSDHQFITA
jgi:hypothetical protein